MAEPSTYGLNTGNTNLSEMLAFLKNSGNRRSIAATQNPPMRVDNRPISTPLETKTWDYLNQDPLAPNASGMSTDTAVQSPATQNALNRAAELTAKYSSPMNNNSATAQFKATNAPTLEGLGEWDTSQTYAAAANPSTYAGWLNDPKNANAVRSNALAGKYDNASLNSAGSLVTTQQNAPVDTGFLDGVKGGMVDGWNNMSVQDIGNVAMGAGQLGLGYMGYLQNKDALKEQADMNRENLAMAKDQLYGTKDDGTYYKDTKQDRVAGSIGSAFGG